MTDLHQVLLITATISPPEGVPNLARTDPAQRLSDYEWALPAYLELFHALIGIDSFELVGERYLKV